MNQKLKRFLSMILAVSMIFGMLVFPTSATEITETGETPDVSEETPVGTPTETPDETPSEAPAANVTIGSAEAKAGETVQVALTLDSTFTDLVEFCFKPVYDSVNLTLTNATVGSALEGICEVQRGFSWHPDAIDTWHPTDEPLPASGEWVVLTFAVAETAPAGAYEISITNTTGPYFVTVDEEYVWEESDVVPTITAGKITVAAEEETCAHTYENGVCTICGEADPDYVPPVTYYTVTLTEGENYTIAPVDGYTTTVEESGEFKFTVTPAEGCQVDSVLAGETELTADENGIYTITVTADVTITVVVGEVDDGKLHGGETITADGTYQLAEDATGIITVAAGVKNVTIVGNGAQWDKDMTSATYGAVTSPVNSQLMFDCTAAAGITLTLKDVAISNEYIGDNTIDFAGTGNTLIFDGTVVIDHDNNAQGYAGIHVAKGTSLNIYGTSGSSIYMYKREQAAGIGANNKEACGTITFGVKDGKNDFYFYMKGTKQGAVIGNGANCPETPGDITFYSGVYNMIANARGALIGGSAGPASIDAGNVYIYGGLLNLNVDYSGAAIGGGGFEAGNDKVGGNVYMIGGSVRPYIDTNAVQQNLWAGITEAGVHDAAITANKLNGTGDAVYMLAVDTTDIPANTTGDPYVIKVDDVVYYSGDRYGYCFCYENVDRDQSGNVYPNGTPGNWIPMTGENCFYLFATGKDHTVDINGTKVTYYWDEVKETFSTEDKAIVSFVVTPEDAEFVLSDGIGYTYLEETHEGRFFEAVEGVEADEENGIEAVEAVPAQTKFSLTPGEYTFTITKDGYYASTGSFKVSEDLHAVSIETSSNINSYLKEDVFTIPMTAFVKSSNAGAWDGVTIDVSWYSETAREMHISTPAQLAGMAAIVNGIYNAEITTIIDDVNGDGVTETYTPYDYAHLEDRKIIAANSGGSTGSNNLVTTSTYWYGAKSEGTYTDEDAVLALPSDFNGQTVYIDCDLDMGGYQVDGVWTGARYMTIGGQSQMHYIDYSECRSDGYAHLGSSFNGTLDGQGHIVRNLFCDRYVDGVNYGDSVSVGLIGRMGCHDGDALELMPVDPTVRNIAVSGYVRGRRSVGGIVGKTGQTSASKIAGDTSTGAIIENCLNFATVKNTDAKGVGGICGAGWNAGVIRNCANYGYVYTSYKNAGGISGSCEVPVINCYNVGYVDATSYNMAQAIGTDNGAATYTNVYWLTGSSLADSNDTYQYPAVYRHAASDTITEITTFEGLTTAEFLVNLNGSTRTWVFPAETDAIYSLMAEQTFQNCKLETAVTNEDGTTTAVSAAGMPVPRCFTTDATTITSIEKTSDPADLEYIATQNFDPTGLEIWATWSDGTKELVEDYTISPAEPLTTEDTVVTVSGTRGGLEYSYSFDITVVANEVNEIRFKTRPFNLLYGLGEPVDTTGMIITAYYTSAPGTAVTLDAEDYTVEFVEDEEGNTNLVVSHTYNGKTVSVSVAVTIMDTPAPTLNGEGYYELSCTNDMLWFANQVNKVGNTAINGVLIADITMGEDFVGIGTSSKLYAGTFDGCNYTVTLTTNTSSSFSGLLACVSGATVKNVIVDGSVTSSNSTTGIAGVVGYVYKNGATIVACVNKADISGTTFVGGIVGKMQTNSLPVTVSNCRNEGAIVSTGTQAGGIVGFLGTKDATASNKFTSADNTFVIECINNGSVTGFSQVGGITGENAGQIQRCVNTGTINALKTGSKAGIGGIAGRNGCNNSAYTKGTIQDCYNTGSIGSSANKWVGGITGFSNAASIVRNCYNIGTVYGAGQANALVGQGEAMPATYAGAGVYNCWYLDSTKVFDASGVYGGHYEDCGSRTEAEMKAPAFAAIMGSAFNVDSANVNSGYPVLKFQGGTAAPAIYTVTIPASGEGYTVSIAEGCTTTVVEGGEFKFSIYLLDGYKIVSVKANDAELTAENGVYTIADIRSDVTVSIEVAVGEIECGHVNTELINAAEASCTQDGYTGDLFCRDCETVVETGAVIPALGHDFVEGKCTRCEETTTYVEAPVVKGSNVASTGKIKLTWNAVEGAAKYMVYRSTSRTGSYSLMFTTSNTSYTNTSAEAGATYYYYVVAAAADGTVSEASSIVMRTCDLARPVVTVSNVAKTGKVRLTWNAVEGATGYKIYRATEKDGTYSLMYTTANTSYTNTKAEAGVTYYYYVVAVCDKAAATSAPSAVKARTCDLARPVVAISLKNGKPRLTWDAVEGAVSYKVYRSESQDGAYSLMFTTSNTSYTNTKCESGVTYYYKVVAVAENTSANSAASALVSIETEA